MVAVSECEPNMVGYSRSWLREWSRNVCWAILIYIDLMGMSLATPYHADNSNSSNVIHALWPIILAEMCTTYSLRISGWFMPCISVAVLLDGHVPLDKFEFPQRESMCYDPSGNVHHAKRTHFAYRVGLCVHRLRFFFFSPKFCLLQPIQVVILLSMETNSCTVQTAVSYCKEMVLKILE